MVADVESFSKIDGDSQIPDTFNFQIDGLRLFVQPDIGAEVGELGGVLRLGS